MTELSRADIDSFERARLARDARFDGLFFIAVKSTGIYCRPICPAPPPKAANITYFRHAAAAAAAGYRPCLRCRPERAPGEAPCDSGDRLFDLALQRLRAGALEERSLAAFAADLGVTDRHLRRLFRQRLGVAPQALHAHHRLLLAKQLLADTAWPITRIALASGFRSLRRFNAAFVEQCGMPPSRIRRQPGRPSAESIELLLAYRPPLDWPALTAFLAARALPGIERVQGESYERVLPGTATGWLRVQPSPDHHALRLQLHLPDPARLPDLLRRLRRLFDLDADPIAITAQLGRDGWLADHLAARPGLRVPGAFDGFEVAVRAVLGQQVSVAAASTLAHRLVERYGRPLAGGLPGLDRAFPAPAVLAAADLRGIGLPSARARSLSGLARAVAERRLDLEAAQPLDAFCERLQQLPGIGPWTAHYIAMRALHHPDACPAGDLVLRQQLGGGAALDERSARQRAEGWRPWRSYGVLHAWAAAAAVAKPSSSPPRDPLS